MNTRKWVYGKYYPGPVIAIDDVESGDVVCYVVEETEDARIRYPGPRARLIVHAPELLEALKDVLDFAERYAELNDEPKEGLCHDAIVLAKAAIKKAEAH